MADTTLIATTLGSAAIAGSFGFLAAWRQGKPTVETTRMQLEGTLAQVQAENERLRVQFAQQHLQHRQGVYHNFLDTVSHIDAILREATPRVDTGELFEERWTAVRDELAGLLRELRHYLNGLVLFGTDDVRAAARELDAMFFSGAEGELRVGLQHGEIQRDTETTITAVSIMLDPWKYNRSRQGWDEVLLKLMAAMRADVAPEPRT